MTTPAHGFLSWRVMQIAEQALRVYVPNTEFVWWVYGIFIFFGALPDLPKWFGDTGWRLYLWLHYDEPDVVPDWLWKLHLPIIFRFIPTYGAHILMDLWVHHEPDRYWIWREGMYREVLVWAVIFLLGGLIRNA